MTVLKNLLSLTLVPPHIYVFSRAQLQFRVYHSVRVNPIAKKFSPIRLQSELEDVLDSVPPEHRKVIEKMMISSSVQMRSMVSPETTVMKKLTSEHISRYLDGAELEMKNSYSEKFHKKVFTFLTMIVAMAFLSL